MKPKEKKSFVPSVKHQWRMAVHASNLNHTARHILLVINEFMKPDGGYAFPSQKTIAHMVGVDEKTVCRALKGAESSGLVKIIKRKVGVNRMVNYYMPVLDDYVKTLSLRCSRIIEVSFLEQALNPRGSDELSGIGDELSGIGDELSGIGDELSEKLDKTSPELAFFSLHSKGKEKKDKYLYETPVCLTGGFPAMASTPPTDELKDSEERKEEASIWDTSWDRSRRLPDAWLEYALSVYPHATEPLVRGVYGSFLQHLDKTKRKTSYDWLGEWAVWIANPMSALNKAPKQGVTKKRESMKEERKQEDATPTPVTKELTQIVKDLLHDLKFDSFRKRSPCFGFSDGDFDALQTFGVDYLLKNLHPACVIEDLRLKKIKLTTDEVMSLKDLSVKLVTLFKASQIGE